MASKRAVFNVARCLRETKVTGVNTARRSYSLAAVEVRRSRCHDDLKLPPLSLSSSYSAVDLVDAPQAWMNMQTRSFAKQKSRGNTKTANTLSNEGLVAEIMKKFPGASPEDVQVRAIMMDKQGEPTNDIISLRLAIQFAVENDRDLIAVSLDQEVPVVKVAALSSIEYQSRKQKSKSSALSIKEFQFKAGIEENDLARKMEQMIGYLRKGHKTKVRIRGTRRALTKNSQAVADTLQEILDMVQEEQAGEPVKQPEFNERKTQCQRHEEQKLLQSSMPRVRGPRGV
eukprot:scaffold567_cov170-Amphora_coffeaeformis.AAC.15